MMRSANKTVCLLFNPCASVSTLISFMCVHKMPSSCIYYVVRLFVVHGPRMASLCIYVCVYVCCFRRNENFILCSMYLFFIIYFYYYINKRYLPVQADAFFHTSFYSHNNNEYMARIAYTTSFIFNMSFPWLPPLKSKLTTST